MPLDLLFFQVSLQFLISLNTSKPLFCLYKGSTVVWVYSPGPSSSCHEVFHAKDEFVSLQVGQKFEMKLHGTSYTRTMQCMFSLHDWSSPGNEWVPRNQLRLLQMPCCLRSCWSGKNPEGVLLRQLFETSYNPNNLSLPFSSQPWYPETFSDYGHSQPYSPV